MVLISGRDDAQDEADRAALLEDVAAEAAEARDAVGEVDVLVLLELLALVGAEERVGHRLGVVLSSRFSSEATTSVPLTRIIG